MGLLDLFKSKPKSTLTFAEIAVDMHSHLVPGIDDGVKTLDDTLIVLSRMKQMGYRKVITTPHINFDYYPNTREGILRGFGAVQEMADRLDLGLELGVAAEYFVDEHFLSLLAKKELMPIHENYVLIEFPFMHKPNNVQHILFDLQSNGYIPVVAHFERYLYWHNQFEVVYQLKEWGGKIQMNLNSISGHYSKEIKVQAEKLIRSGVIDFVASDCHRIEHVQLMENLPQLNLFHAIKDTNSLLNTTL